MKSDRTKSLLSELFAKCIEIESGKQKFLLGTPEALQKLRGGKRRPAILLKAIRLGAVKTEARSRKRTAATLKVDPNLILTQLEDAAQGLRMRDIASELRVPWQGLIASLRFLKRRRKVFEANGFYFLAGSARPQEKVTAERSSVSRRAQERAQAASRRLEKACTFEDCKKPHYAKGLCNNHYNIERRRAAASNELDPEIDIQKRKAYRLTILNALREQKSGITLFNLGNLINEKWQTLRQPANELVRERLVAKRGKLYMPLAGEDDSDYGK